MKRTNLPATLQSLLKAVPYATIATANSDGIPWNTPVVGFFDEELSLYWASWTYNQHSLNIATEPRIFAVVYDSSCSLGQGEGLYLQMIARPLTAKADIAQAKHIYTDRFGEEGCPTPFAGICPRRIYKAVPYAIWHNTDGARGEHFVDTRQALFE